MTEAEKISLAMELFSHMVDSMEEVEEYATMEQEEKEEIDAKVWALFNN